MPAEILLLKLETQLRETPAKTATASDRRFALIALPRS
jgi:hypothetical protein